MNGKQRMLNAYRGKFSDTYLLEGWLGVPFFDYYASGREGGMQTAILDFFEHKGFAIGAKREVY